MIRVETNIEKKKVEFDVLAGTYGTRMYGAMRYDKTRNDNFDWLDSSTVSLYLNEVFADVRRNNELESEEGKQAKYGYSRIVELRCEVVDTAAILINSPYEPEKKEEKNEGV